MLLTMVISPDGSRSTGWIMCATWPPGLAIKIGMLDGKSGCACEWMDFFMAGLGQPDNRLQVGTRRKSAVSCFTG